jgi:hypothetical protein
MEERYENVRVDSRLCSLPRRRAGLLRPKPGSAKPDPARRSLCVGPACVGGRRAYHDDDDWRWRDHPGYGYDHGCRAVTVRKRTPDGDFVMKHIRRCD